MRPELDRLHLIEQQLLQTPAALPASEWHLRQLFDGELTADAALQRQLYHGLHQAGRQQLKRELRTIHTQLYGSPGPRWLAALRRCWPW
ncbi:hypothetical protein Q5H93_00860 [Hymenobacter sp. ASUV-10]|uniref:Uncharacterized protein n=1 Tax=Hymenobacter aranciens TaxID=3063996 RepID=A0ABT9B6D0_9BACT|nr:hypothetical protein [Hymenobacter sp. ASUV-10]MDO7873264.1 hypothetical protein [Hymenobacter sp. ASUV-10]